MLLLLQLYLFVTIIFIWYFLLVSFFFVTICTLLAIGIVKHDRTNAWEKIVGEQFILLCNTIYFSIYELIHVHAGILKKKLMGKDVDAEKKSI